MAKVSIIIPTYNVEMYLVECMESVVNQTLKDIEIICVDDGSTDSSPQIIKEYMGIQMSEEEQGFISLHIVNATMSQRSDRLIISVQLVRDVLAIVYRALMEKGYNPVNQIVGYIMSGDPTYITSHNNARSLIMKVERDELVEEMLKAYIRNNNWE